MIFFKSNIPYNRYRILRDRKSEIEPEEILMDAREVESLDRKGEIEQLIGRKSFAALVLLCFVVLLFLAGRTGYLVMAKGKEFEHRAQLNKTQTALIMAPRGNIYDRDGQLLAFNKQTYDLSVIPTRMPKGDDKFNSLFNIIASTLSIDRIQLDEIFSDLNYYSSDSEVIVPDIEEQKALVLENLLESFNGVEVERNFWRQYALGGAFAQTLGYVRKMSGEETEIFPDYYLNEQVGKVGLERQYETYLHGQVGKKESEMDSLGQKQMIQSIKEPTQGDNLYLTIDSELQSALFDSLAEAVKNLGFKSKRAAGIILDAKTGRVLAMASLPSYDPNIFTGRLDKKEWERLVNDPDEPFLNRVISGLYPPGSTAKIIIGAAGLNEGVITPKTKIFSSGNMQVPSIYDPNIVYNFPDWRAHGLVDFYQAIAWSSNIYFYTVGGGFGDIKGLGINKITEYYNLFGFNQKTGIDLPGERAGLVPSPEWKKKYKNEEWFLGDTYHVSIGQGDLLVSPVELAVATAAIANGGKLVSPFLVDKITDVDENIIEETMPRLIRQLPISDNSLSEVKKAMREMIVNGTGQSLNDLPIAVAAKTGSAQFSIKSGKTRTWFTGFAPFDDPEIVVTLLVEEGELGRSSIMPAAKKIFQLYTK